MWPEVSIAYAVAAALTSALLAAGLVAIGMLIERWRTRSLVRIVNLTDEDFEALTDDGEYEIVRVEHDREMCISAVYLRRRWYGR